MKRLALIALTVIMAVGAFPQITGKYTAEKFMSNHDTIVITTSQNWPIEVSGDSYVWQISSKWKTTSKITTSTAKLQYSPDGTNWLLIETDSLKSGNPQYFAGTDTPFRYLRYLLTVTSGDTVKGFNAWYEFRRK